MDKSTTEMLRGTLVNIKLDNSCSALWQECLLVFTINQWNRKLIVCGCVWGRDEGQV